MTRPGLLLVLLAALALVALAAPAQAQVRPHECTYCHSLHGGGGAIPLTIYNLDVDLCMSCHDDAAPATYDGKTVPKGVAVHGGAKHTGGDQTTCKDCHNHFGQTNGNLKLIPSSLASRYTGTKSVVFTARTGPNSFADGDGTIDGICEVCHTGTLYQLADGSNNAHNAQAQCTTCHTHDSGFQPSGCTGCHNQGQPTGAPVRRPIVPEFDYTSHHINWNAAGYASAQDIPDEQCQVCHDQTNHQGGTVWLKDVDVPANGPYSASVAADVATFCTTCHDADAANGAAPFADGMLPPVIDGAKWSATGHGNRFATGACLECHSSGHGKQKVDLYAVCETCHGPNPPPAAYVNFALYAKTHVDPNNATAQWSMDCLVCHTPHYDLPNRYNFPPYVAAAGDLHLHNASGDAGGLVPGVNIKLMARLEDGTGMAKVQTPLRILGEGAAGPCTNSNTELQIALPPFSAGNGPPHTIMVGDRISLSNAGPNFTGVYRVKETNWNAWPNSGWVCFDHPNAPVTTTGFGYLRSGGWYPRPVVQSATWAGGTATLTFSGPTSLRYGIHSIQVGDWINVLGVAPAGYNGRYQVTARTDASVSYALGSDPGPYSSGGNVEYLSSVKAIQTAAVQSGPGLPITAGSWANAQGQKPARATITVAGHPYQANDTLVVSGVPVSGYNGTFTVYEVTANTITYPLAANPGACASPCGGTVPDPAGLVLLLTLNANNNDASILNIKPASGGQRNGDIVSLYGVDPIAYDGRYEVTAVDSVSNPPTLTLRCGPYLRTALSAPPCTIGTLPVYVSGGFVQSSGSLRAVMFDSRGGQNTDVRFLNDFTHSFTNTDNDGDGWMDSPCETCHTLTSNHQNDDYGNTHNNGKTCTNQCHFHSVAFDKANDTCPGTRTCPPVK